MSETSPLRLAAMLTAVAAAVLVVIALTLGFTNVSAGGENCGTALSSIGADHSLTAVDHGPECVSALDNRRTVVWVFLAAGLAALAGASVLEGHYRSQRRAEQHEPNS